MTNTTNDYDAIVVGARCAGAPTAMLLARRGHRVLLVDRATFPSDTVSTHMIHAPGVAALRRWGVLDDVVASGCPPIDTYRLDFGPFTISGTPVSPVLEADGPGGTVAYAPRRTVLDKILVDAAVAAGAEVREDVTVDEVLFDGDRVVGIRSRGADGCAVADHARVVIGADGSRSVVARAVQPREYHTKPILQWGAYTYWQDLPVDGFETFVRPDRGFGVIPTNDGLTLVVVGWPAAEAAAYRSDVAANYLATLELVPSFAERARAATRVERFRFGGAANFFRQSYGPGWVLVGDAGYTKDPITAQGMTDAFLGAERCAAALDAWFGGHSSFDDVMRLAQHARDEHAMPMFELTTQLATLAPPPPEVQHLLGAIEGNQPAMDAFTGVIAGTMSPVAFFDPEHIGRLLGAQPV